MASPTVAPRHHPARVLVRIAVALTVAMALGAVALATWLYVAARSALPQVDGTVSVTGLSAPVTIIRDAQGVPHITAANLQDLLFAQGYITAQDRLWQMDMTRRYAAGELAEVLGPKYIESDRVQRTLGMRQVAQRAAAAMAAEDRSKFDAYAAGVNGYISSHRKTLPIEFRVLRYTPTPWTVEDSLLVGSSFFESLNLGAAVQMLEREKVMARIPAELAADLYPMTSWRDHPPGQDAGALPDAPDTGAQRDAPSGKRRNQFRRHTGEFGPRSNGAMLPGSNNWVISGAHTVTGKPLLSNDMHLPHHIPNVWYETQLTAGDFDVAGVTAPGLPGILVGHNQRIAWGFTNLNPAALDVYVETFSRAGEYEIPGGWQKAEHRREVIKVRGEHDVVLEVVVTRHGPIVSGLVPGEGRKLALKWTLWEPSALQLDAILEWDHAQNWDEFRRAFSHFGGPGQNVVYADVDGHIGYQATGFVPLRKTGDGSKPVPGNTDEYEWTGYLPFDKMPSVFDPTSGIIATANNRITPDGYPYVISAEWMSPERVDRIYRVLQANKKFSAADMLALQNDIDSEFDRFCAQRFVYSVDHTAKASPRARQAADLMRQWNGRMTTDSAAATIVSYAREELERLLLEPLLGPAHGKAGTGWRQYAWPMSSVWLENLLLRHPAAWLPKNFDSWDELLTAAVERAVDRKGAPPQLASWRWGEVAPIYVKHPIFGRVWLLNRWTGPGLRPQSGDSHTVKQVRRDFGPSERMTVDLSHLDSSTLNLVTGESGNIFSPHYMDQWEAWYRGTTFPFPFTAAAAAKARGHELRLVPAD